MPNHIHGIVRGEAIVDGDASDGIEFVLYAMIRGVLQAVELNPEDEFNITDVFISQNKDSAYAVVAGTDSPGERIVKGRLLEMGSVNVRFETPFITRPNGQLVYIGDDNGLNVALIHG